MTLFEILTNNETGVGIPVAYSHFTDKNVPKSPPYLVYIGDGQDTFEADNTHYWTRNRYQLEYYYTKKNETEEAVIEQVLLDNGFLYDKSEDVFIENEGVFVIYYNI